MGHINFYLDKPFNPESTREKINAVIKENNLTGKPYPKSILNPRPNSIYLFFSHEKGTRVKVKTSFKASGDQWDFKTGKYRSAMRGSLELNNELDELGLKVLKGFSKLKEEKKFINDEDIKILLTTCTVGEKIINNAIIENASSKFLERKTGILKEGTLKEYKTVFKSLKDFQANKKITLSFNDFNQSFFNEYERFLVDKKNPYKKERGLLNDTIFKYSSTLKSFLEWCFDEGLIKSRDAFSRAKTKIKKKAKNEIVALTEPELFRLVNFDFKGNTRLERIRDLFCIGCFTGQRFSDIMRFDKQDFTGTKWSFVAFKGKKRVVVPFNGYIANAIPILQKYNYQLPTITNQKFNEYLKEVGELVGIDDTVRIIRFSGVKEVETRQSKYKFMSSHMARRTFVTLMIEKGVPLTMIQKITQHSDLRTLLKYEGHNDKSLENAFKKT
ncbi:MAG: tyrosine-type recombinase/integrase [Chitinophagaceae bacterium]